MIDKKKIIKVDVYSLNENLIVSSDNLNIAQSESKYGDTCCVILKINGINEIPMGTKVDVVFNYINGDRVKHEGTVDVCTEFQINITIGNKCTLLEEKRRFYKLETDLSASVSQMIKENDEMKISPPVSGKIKNINIGGVFLECESEFSTGDTILIGINVLGSELNLASRILRTQKNKDSISGYGCAFIKLRYSEEEILARYINTVQRATLDEIKHKLDKR